jgi:hypothetical protein
MTTTVVPTTVDEFLEVAADHLDDYGWTKYAFRDECGRKCTLGALNDVYTNALPAETFSVAGGPAPSPMVMIGGRAVRVLADHLRTEYPTELDDRMDDWNLIIQFNDVLAKHVGEVTSALRKAAIRAREVAV